MKRFWIYMAIMLAGGVLSAQQKVTYTIKGDTVIYPFYNGLAKVEVEHVGIIDTTGRQIMPIWYFDAPLYFGANQFRPLDSHSPECIGYVVNYDESADWFDREGNVLVKEGKAMYGVSDTIPEVLWKY